MKLKGIIYFYLNILILFSHKGNDSLNAIFHNALYDTCVIHNLLKLFVTWKIFTELRSVLLNLEYIPTEELKFSIFAIS